MSSQRRATFSTEGGGLLGWLLRCWLSVLIGIGVLGAAGAAQASVNVPLHHWTYEAIEQLVALRVIDRAMLVPKPYSRKQAAKYVAQAIRRVRADQVPLDGSEAIAGPLLYRLAREFRPELADLGVLRGRSAQRLGAVRYGGRLQIESGAFFVGKETVRFRENRRGEYYANGPQVQTDIRGWVELTDALALSAQPKVVSNDKVLGIGANANDKHVWFQELNAKLSVFNIAFEVGRGSLWWGPGYHGSLLLTDHTFPLDMVRVGSDEPFQLPWILEPLGDWKVNSFLARLERDRDFPRANVFGLRLSYLPKSWLELGFTRLTQFNGRGRGSSFPEAVLDAYFFRGGGEGDRDVNEQVAVDLRARVPRVPYLIPFPAGLQFYGELASEDRWETTPNLTRAAFLVGVYIPQVFRKGTMDLRIEYADTDFTRRTIRDNIPQIWYNNAIYVSGMRSRGFPLGHHMGTDAIDFFVRSTRYLNDNLQFGTSFNWQERDRGQTPHETKREASLDLTWWVSDRTQVIFGYTYQRIKNPGQITSINPFVETFATDVTSHNHLLWTTLAVYF